MVPSYVIKISIQLGFLVGWTLQLEITQAYPSASNSAPIHYVKEGESTHLSCTFPEKYATCQWKRPGAAKPCDATGSEKGQICKHSEPISEWAPTRKVGENTCTVNIDRVAKSDVGEWFCVLEDSAGPISNSTRVEIADPPKVVLDGPRELYFVEGENQQFHCKATGRPAPTVIKWSISNRPIPGLVVESENKLENGIEQLITAVVSNEWDKLSLVCEAFLEDSEGNKVTNTDHRRLGVKPERKTDFIPYNQLRGTSFYITDRRPEGKPSTIPQVLLARDVEVTFSCTSNMPWNICRWVSPFVKEACAMLSDQYEAKTCSGWINGGEWKVRKDSGSACSITGTIQELSAGEWNCELQSNPLASENNLYERDQQFFEVKIVSMPEITITFPEELDLRDGESHAIEIDIRGADPKPEVIWRLNTKEFKPVMIESDPPYMESDGTWSLHQIVDFQAQDDDNGKKLFCIIRQEDSEGNVVEQTYESYLRIQARSLLSPRSSLGAGIIAAIVSVGVLILVIIILLCVSYRTGRLCFKNRKIQALADAEDQEMAMLNRPADGVDPSNTYAQDGKVAHMDEGAGSRAESLESLNEPISDRDWKDTIQKMGPKFADMAEEVRGNAQGFNREPAYEGKNSTSSENEEDDFVEPNAGGGNAIRTEL